MLSPTELAVRGWKSHLAAFVTGLFFIQALTGLWIWIGPFSVVGQFQVLLHVAAGLLFLLPFLVYQVWHLSVWWRQRVTAEMVLGYLAMAAVLVCIVTGCVLAWQSAFRLRIHYGWDLVHLIAGLASLPILCFHLALVLIRRRSAGKEGQLVASAQRLFFLRLAVGTMLPFALLVPLSIVFRSPESVKPIPAGYTLSEHIQAYEEYRDSPFAPSNARTEGATLIEPFALAGSDGCGTKNCHSTILAEWQPSAHRFSAMNPPFQQVQREFAADREPAETRYCAGCHDPISLFAGAKDLHVLDLSAPGMNEGISCVACHAVSKVDQGGNADYVVTAPKRYLWEGSTGARKWLSDFLIRSWPQQHLRDYDRNVLRTPEFCAACHKQFIPEALNRFGFVAGQNQYDEWRNSHWHTDDPGDDLSCRDCHMRIVHDSDDPGHGEGGDVRRSPDDGAHRHHGFIATNSFMPEVLKLPHWETQVELTEEWLRGETVLPEIDELWPRGPVASIQIQAPEDARPGEEIEIRVIVTNRKAGHNYVTGPLDFVRSWVHLTVADQRGSVLFESGAIDPETRRIMDDPESPHKPGNRRDTGTMVLEGAPIDEHGEELQRHELWKKAGGLGKRVVFPGYSDSQVYRVTVPPGTTGPLSIRADLNYRRYEQRFLDLVVPAMEKDSGVFQPTVTQSSDTAVLNLSSVIARP